MVNSYCMVTRYSEVLQSLYFPAKRKCDSNFFYKIFPSPISRFDLPNSFQFHCQKLLIRVSNFDSILKQIDCFFLIKDQSVILPPVVLFLRFHQWSHVARNLWETWKSGRKFLFVIVYFCCLQKLSCLVFLFVLWDQIYSDLVVVFERPCPAPKID